MVQVGSQPTQPPVVANGLRRRHEAPESVHFYRIVFISWVLIVR